MTCKSIQVPFLRDCHLETRDCCFVIMFAPASGESFVCNVCLTWFVCEFKVIFIIVVRDVHVFGAHEVPTPARIKRKRKRNTGDNKCGSGAKPPGTDHCQNQNRNLNPNPNRTKEHRFLFTGHRDCLVHPQPRPLSRPSKSHVSSPR